MTTDTWTIGDLGDWSTASDWSLGAVPSSTTDALISNFTSQVTISGSAVANSLTLNGTYLIDTGTLTLDTSLNLDNVGTFWLRGGTLSAQSIISEIGGQIVGYGTVSGAVSGPASTVAEGGTLTILNSLAGVQGGFAVETGATLVLSNSNTAEQVQFVGVGTLKLGTPAAFTGSINITGGGGTIDLAGIIASSATLSGTTLTINETNGQDLVYTNVTSNLPIGASVASDENGGTLVTFGPPHVVPTINVQNVSVAENTSIAASSLITSITNPSGDSITQYGFEDLGNGPGQFVVGGAIQPYGQWTYVAASNLGSVQYVGGSSAGNATLNVEVYDATSGTWLTTNSLTATTGPNPTGGQSTLVAPLANTFVQGSGYDTLNLSQNPIATVSSSYTMTSNHNGTFTLATTGSSDLVSGIVQVQFSDRTVTVAANGSENEYIALLYQGALGRTPDAAGLAGWEQIEAALPAATQAMGIYGLSDVSANYNGSLSIAAGFTNSTEFIAKYSTLSPTQFVTQLYANILDRTPDPAGLAGWLAQLSAGASEAHVLVGFADSQEAINNATLGFTGQSGGVHAAWLLLT